MKDAIEKAWDAFCDGFDLHSNEWLDKGAGEMFKAGYLAALRAQPAPTVPDNMQDWKGMDGTIAWHLIERHADNWSDVGKMMSEWLEANRAQPEKLFTSKDMEREFEDGMRREAEIWKKRLDTALQQLRFVEEQNRAILTRVADLTAFQVPTIYMTMPPSAQPDHSELIAKLRVIANKGFTDYFNSGHPNSNVITKAANALEGL